MQLRGCCAINIEIEFQKEITKYKRLLQLIAITIYKCIMAFVLTVEKKNCQRLF